MHAFTDDSIPVRVQSTAYLMAVATGGERWNLDGTPAGVPDEGQHAFAYKALRRRRKWPVETMQGAADVPMVSE